MGEPPGSKALGRVNGKVIVVGKAGVGKTCLVERFVNDRYAADDPAHGATLGTDCQQKRVFIDSSTEVYLFIYDTAGQERFADLAASYYRVGEVCLLCFDMSDMSSFDNVAWWLRKVRGHNDKCSFILVGTKEDSVEEGTSLEPVTAWAEENGIAFFQTSALRGGANINFLFHTVAEKCARLSREKQLSEAPSGGGGGQGLRLQSGFGAPKKGGCC